MTAVSRKAESDGLPRALSFTTGGTGDVARLQYALILVLGGGTAVAAAVTALQRFSASLIPLLSHVGG